MRKCNLYIFILIVLCGTVFGVEPIARYDFENNLNDSGSSPAYNLTETGTINYDISNFQTGAYSAIFNGTSFGTTNLPDLTQQTYMFWIYPTADSFPLSRDASSRFEVRVLDQEILVYLNSNITIDTRTTGALDLPYYQWSHVAITLDETSGKASLYINRILWKTVTTSRTISGEPLYVGGRAYSGGTSPFKGKLDDLRVYDYIWDSNEEVCSISDVKALTDDVSIDISTEIKRGVASPTASLSVRHLLYEDEDTLQSPFLELNSGYQTILAGETISINLADSGLVPKLWSPEFPNLYLLRTQIVDASDIVIAERDETIGFRKFETVGKNFHLNGRPFYLFGLAQTPPNRIPGDISNDPEFIAQHIARLKAMNVNYVRVHDDLGLWLEACDRAGIMVFTGSYSTGDFNHNFPILQDVIALAKNHPSVTVYSLGNEWSQEQTASDAKLLYDAVKAIDPSRLMFNAWSGGRYDDNDPRSIQEQIGSDFLDYHTYGGWYSGDPYGMYNYHLRWFPEAEFPVTISEILGAYTNDDPNGGGYYLGGVGHNKTLGAALRHIGHSYDWDQDSLDYQSWLGGEVTETCRRNRSVTDRMCGPIPFTSAYAYGYYDNPDDKTEYAKPVIDTLAKAYEPVHLSIRNTTPNQYAGDTIAVTAFVLNDDYINYYPVLPASTLLVDLLDKDGVSLWNDSYTVSPVNYYGTWSQDIVIDIPASLSMGNYILRARLRLDSNDLSVTDSNIFVASQSWTQIVNSDATPVAVYDVTGETITDLQGLGVPLVSIAGFDDLSSSSRLIIGKDSFDSTVVAAESLIRSFIEDDKRVLILEQNSSAVVNAFNGSNWLGTSLGYGTTAESGEPFVNIERPYLNTLMDGLSRHDFREWNGVSPLGNAIARYNFENDLNDTGALPANNITETGSITFNGSNKQIGEYAADFDGSSFGTVTLPDLTQQTYAFWVYPTVDGDSYILSRDASSRFEVRFYYGELLVYFNSTARKFDTRDTSEKDIPLNTWTHVAITLDEDAGVAKLYINKALRNEVPTGVTISGEPLYVGARAYEGGTQAFQGLIDDLQIYGSLEMKSVEPQDRDLYSRPIVMSYDDMDECAVLANASVHLKSPVLVEIFPIASTGGSCILSQLYTVDRTNPDPKAAKYLANLIDYLIEDQPHYQYVTTEPAIKFGDFKSERGVVFSPALQGMSIANSGDWKGERAGRTFVGEMNPTSLRLYEGNPADTEICPLYLRSFYEIGNDITVDVENNYTGTLSYKLIVNGQVTTTKQVAAGSRQQDIFNVTPIAAGTDIKFEIEADEGEHFDTYDTGLVFYSIKLYTPITGDLNFDAKVDLFDFVELSKDWCGEYGIEMLNDLACHWLESNVL